MNRYLPGLPRRLRLRLGMARLNVSVILASLALFVSVVNAYFSWFRASRALEVVVTDVENHTSAFSVRFVSINKGNRPVALVGVNLVLGGSRHRPKWDEFPFAGVPSGGGQVVDPGKVLIETIRWPAGLICAAGGNAQPDPSDPSNDEKGFVRANVGLRVRAVTDLGAVWDSIHAIAVIRARFDPDQRCFAHDHGFALRTFSVLKNGMEDYLSFPFLELPPQSVRE